MLLRNGEMTKMYEKVVGFGLGYLVYKRIMSELAMAPDKEDVTVKAGQLLGWDTPAEFEQGLRLWAGVPEGATVKGGFHVTSPTPKGPYWVNPDWATFEPPKPWGGGFKLGTGITRLTYEQALGGGPSRTGITRPKGLD